MKLQRLLINLRTENLIESMQFYTTLFDFQAMYESDWFIQLVSDDKGLELGLIQTNHAIVPPTLGDTMTGAYITLVVDDVDHFYAMVQQQEYEIIQPPEAMFYGQKRLLLRAPEGTVCDVSSPIKG